MLKGSSFAADTGTDHELDGIFDGTGHDEKARIRFCLTKQKVTGQKWTTSFLLLSHKSWAV